MLLKDVDGGCWWRMSMEDVDQGCWSRMLIKDVVDQGYWSKMMKSKWAGHQLESVSKRGTNLGRDKPKKVERSRHDVETQGRLEELEWSEDRHSRWVWLKLRSEWRRRHNEGGDIMKEGCDDLMLKRLEEVWSWEESLEDL
jgi:hypothetical protein